MHELARKEVRAAAELVVARVLEAEQGGLVIQEGEATYEARRARSCLLRPDVGDRVLAAITSDGEVFITAVLDGDASVTLEAEGDLELRAPAGKVKVASRDGVEVCSPGTVDLAAAAVTVAARAGTLAIDKLNISGTVARAAWDQVRLVARGTESVVDRVVQRLRTRLTRVSDADYLHARNLHQEVDDVHAQQSGYTLMRARNEVRIDGKQILMG